MQAQDYLVAEELFLQQTPKGGGMMQQGKPCVIHVRGREGAMPTQHRSQKEIQAGRPKHKGGTHQIMHANSGVKSGVGENIPGIYI